jgi:DNA repair protein RadC
MRKEKTPASQLSFLAPDDALLLHQFRLFMAEATRIYETRTGKLLEDALTIRAPKDAYEFLRLEMEDLEQEQLRVINLNTRNRVVSTRMVYQGSANMVTARAAEVFRPAIIDNAPCLIVAHNHPSGDPSPSPEDVQFTQQLVRAAKLSDLELLDHIVIGKGRFVSLKERGLGFDVGPENYTLPSGQEDQRQKGKRISPTSSRQHPSA